MYIYIRFFGDQLAEGDLSTDESGTLKIKKTQAGQRGKYKCIATNDVGNAMREVTLSVHSWFMESSQKNLIL